jgi:hypothetical protein
MKSGSPRKAPKVAPPSKKNPNFMRESDKPTKGKSPMSPMTGKKLSK